MTTLQFREEHLSDLTLDRWFADEFAGAELRDLEAHVARCARCRSRRQALQAQHALLLERMPSWAGLAARCAKPKRRAPTAWIAGALAAAAVALLALSPHREPAGVRSKGRASLGVFLKRGERVTRAQPGDTVRPGDLLRVTYSSATQVELAVLHHDAHSASIFYPLTARTTPAPAGRDLALDFSIRLDDEPGDETLYGLFCEEPVELPPLRAALAATGHITPPAHCHVDIWTFVKQLDAR